MALPQKYRLIRRLDFDKVFQDGKAVKGSFLFIKSRTNELSFPRFGFVVPKKVYLRAVDRNRLKRVLSEMAALYVKNNPTNSQDFVVVVNKQEKEELIKNELISFLRFSKGNNR